MVVLPCGFVVQREPKIAFVDWVRREAGSGPVLLDSVSAFVFHGRDWQPCLLASADVQSGFA